MSVLNPDERLDVLFYAGYSAFEDDGPAVRAVNSVESHPEMAPRIRLILDELRDVDRQISEVKPLAKAVKDGKIELRAAYSLDVLRDLGRQAVTRLCLFLAIRRKNDVFSSAPGNTDGASAVPQSRDYSTVGPPGYPPYP